MAWLGNDRKKIVHFLSNAPLEMFGISIIVTILLFLDRIVTSHLLVPGGAQYPEKAPSNLKSLETFWHAPVWSH